MEHSLVCVVRLILWLVVVPCVMCFGRPSGDKGDLFCDGVKVESEVVYWRKVAGDAEYESRITPHHREHSRKYITFDYTHGGWNNVRMDFESVLVLAHATGRTLVVPPPDKIYLLHDKVSGHTKRVGFADYYNFTLLKSQQGLHLISMPRFLRKEALRGGLKQAIPLPAAVNQSKVWGKRLWDYLAVVADVAPSLQDKFIVFPQTSKDFNLSEPRDDRLRSRLAAFKKQFLFYQAEELEREALYYDEKMQSAKHIHIRGDGFNCILQHFYGFAFFAEPSTASFYKRFVRDFLRYKDSIQCAAHSLVAAVRAESLKENPDKNGEYFALHIRRGDLQFKEVKISAADIVANLVWPNGSALIPRGSLVYVATDDPDGKCAGCTDSEWRPCAMLKPPLPVGCMQDTSWNAFLDAGWRIRFLRDFTSKGLLGDVSEHLFGAVESIVCARSSLFAGTYLSTFTGHIYRLRGYYGLGEQTFYHSPGVVHALQHNRSVGSGWAREWRTGWTDDDAGNLI